MASNSVASRSSPRTSRKRPASASKRARRSAASLAATMSVRVRFPGFDMALVLLNCLQTVRTCDDKTRIS
jgi:hypothetical protein